MDKKITPTPWAAFKDPQTGNWFVVNSPSGLVCDMDGSGLTEEANARHIVHCVNNHEKLVEVLRSIQNDIAETGDVSDESCDMMDTVISDLAALEAEKEGEL